MSTYNKAAIYLAPQLMKVALSFAKETQKIHLLVRNRL